MLLLYSLFILFRLKGKHINLRAPPKSGSTYYNYKKQFSVVLLAVCDADYKFTYVNVGAYGSQSDGGVFRNSALGKMLEHKEIELPEPESVNGSPPLPYFLVGDAAFPLKTFLMKPYGGLNLDVAQSKHNTELSRGRVCIEDAFGVLSGRWRVFRNTMEILPKYADDIITAAILLHNYAIASGDHRYSNLTGNPESETQNFLPIPFRLGARNATAEAYKIRDDVTNIL